MREQVVARRQSDDSQSRAHELADRLYPSDSSSISDAETLLDAALAALSGRVRIHEGSSRNVESIITELFLSVFGTEEKTGGEPRGKVLTPGGGTTG